MNSATTRVKRLITRYFNQLLRGCQNPLCQNPHCASSPQFQHATLTANQAAILAIQLTNNQAHLCYPDDEVTYGGTENMPSTSEEHESSEQLASSQANTSSNENVSTNTVTAPVNPPSTIAESASLTNVLEAEESSRSSLMSPGEVTRLLMFLFDATENEDIGSSVENQPSLAEGTGSRPSRYSTLFTGSYGLGGLDDAPTSGTSSAARPSSSTLAPFLDNPVATSDTLKSFLSNTNPSNNLASLVSSLNTIQERELRTNGLTLDELKESLEICKQQGGCSHLTSLLSAVFSSYEALSSSFLSGQLEPSPDLEVTAHGTIDEKREEEMMLHDIPMDVTLPTEETTSRACGEIPMDHQDDSSDVSTSSHTVKESQHDDNATSKSPSPMPPVSIPDVRLAWSMITSVAEQQTVVDVLLRAVRRLVVGSLYQMLVSQAPDGLGDTDPPPDVKNTQQRLLNLVCILYECPFATDPLHFDHLLLNINRAVSWLPINLQARLCHIWAETVRLPLANCTTPPPPEQTTLWSLQSILQQNITLRCLTTSHGVPNEDKQLCEAALVLRIVYYASLLAGQMDSEELLNREMAENREFEQLMREYRVNEPRVGRSRNTTIEDPLAKALALSPNDCRHPFIPAKDFINETLNEHLKAKRDYVNYRSKDTFGELSFMRLPFLLQTSAKSVLLYYDNRMRMLDEQRGAFLQSFFVDNPELPYLKIHVSRDQIVEGALLALEITCSENPSDLKKQLRVEFEGEQGVDEGGLSREFFQLIIEKVFDPVYGMFVSDDELGTYWFNPVPLEDLDREYFLIGTLLGLAIYNDIILNVCFPSVLYRKLAGKLGTFEDLEDANPHLYSGLRALLDYDGDDIETAFGCNFVVAYQDPFGNTLYHELKPNGEDIPVSKSNRREFVDLYANFLLNESVKKPFNAFRRGFQLVIDESPLNFLFRPDEIELLVRGSRCYDFKELERVTTYEDYTADSPVIKHFWDVVHTMTADQQRQLLQFCTGSDRIPVGGMAKMKFTIARQGADTDRLPTAHTCFNILLLPEYPSREQLERMLLLAITHCKGFGVS